MIRSFSHKHLQTLWETGKSRIDTQLHGRILRRLDALDVAEKPEDMSIVGFNFHPLNGFKPTRYTVHINGPWCITFSFADGNAEAVNLEQYH